MFAMKFAWRYMYIACIQMHVIFGCTHVYILDNSLCTFQIYFSQVELVAAGFLMFSLSCTALVVSCLCFRLTRSYGALLIILYIIFLVTSILAEAGVLHISITGVLTR